MTAQTVPNYFHNGKQNGVARVAAKNSPKFWPKIQINEWTFSFFLFALSLAIVAGKLFINYGDATRRVANVEKGPSSLFAFSHVYEAFASGDSHESSQSNEAGLGVASEKLANASRAYGEAIASIFQRFRWLLRASFFGVATMAFAWFVIYKDSSVPGVNPPLPFSPSKRQYPEKPRLQINYLVGALNGFLIFIYMCL